MENKIIIKKKKNLFTKCLGCLSSKIPNKVCVTMRYYEITLTSGAVAKKEKKKAF